MFFTRRPRADQAHLELVQQIHGLHTRLKLAEESLQALQAAHERLRGRFYALRGKGEETPQSKAEILRNFGFVPGQPPPHK